MNSEPYKIRNCPYLPPVLLKIPALVSKPDKTAAEMRRQTPANAVTVSEEILVAEYYRNPAEMTKEIFHSGIKTQDMFLPNNTRIVKVMNMTEEGEEWMVEERVITEMVYWDMVGTLSFNIEEPDADAVIFSEQGGRRDNARGAALPHPLGRHNGNSDF